MYLPGNWMSVREAISTACSGTSPHCSYRKALLTLIGFQSLWDHFGTTAAVHLQHAGSPWLCVLYKLTNRHFWEFSPTNTSLKCVNRICTSNLMKTLQDLDSIFHSNYVFWRRKCRNVSIFGGFRTGKMKCLIWYLRGSQKNFICSLNLSLWIMFFFTASSLWPELCFHRWIWMQYGGKIPHAQNSNSIEITSCGDMIQTCEK